MRWNEGTMGGKSKTKKNSAREIGCVSGHLLVCYARLVLNINGKHNNWLICGHHPLLKASLCILDRMVAKIRRQENNVNGWISRHYRLTCSTSTVKSWCTWFIHRDSTANSNIKCGAMYWFQGINMYWIKYENQNTHIVPYINTSIIRYSSPRAPRPLSKKKHNTYCHVHSWKGEYWILPLKARRRRYNVATYDVLSLQRGICFWRFDQQLSIISPFFGKNRHLRT